MLLRVPVPSSFSVGSSDLRQETGYNTFHAEQLELFCLKGHQERRTTGSVGCHVLYNSTSCFLRWVSCRLQGSNQSPTYETGTTFELLRTNDDAEEMAQSVGISRAYLDRGVVRWNHDDIASRGCGVQEAHVMYRLAKQRDDGQKL